MYRVANYCTLYMYILVKTNILVGNPVHLLKSSLFTGLLEHSSLLLLSFPV